jgi:hypothetical protein
MMKQFFVVVALGLSAMACGNECDDAEDTLEECLGELPEGEGEEDVDCNESAECAAKCINDASCDDIKATFQEFEMNSLTTCLSKCPAP